MLPQTISVLQTFCPNWIELNWNHQEFEFSNEFFLNIQYPGKYGQVYDYADFIKKGMITK
jgi:glycine dehydrogenase